MFGIVAVKINYPNGERQTSKGMIFRFNGDVFLSFFPPTGKSWVKNERKEKCNFFVSSNALAEVIRALKTAQCTFFLPLLFFKVSSMCWQRSILRISGMKSDDLLASACQLWENWIIILFDLLFKLSVSNNSEEVSYFKLERKKKHACRFNISLNWKWEDFYFYIYTYWESPMNKRVFSLSVTLLFFSSSILINLYSCMLFSSSSSSFSLSLSFL